ncbi:positive regulator of sigma E activity [Planomicrobium stackebrandtii]|uniref:Positive regulator of sigma E activity n=1 Tax=Planomicrobium stackebrandtii TaxID=253160 RepID=A0ABU0GWU7_9BACL|nr:positive regulator of sigma E activity [Planomicrobium stackebrandtii]
MEKKKIGISYIYMIVAAIGMLLLAFGLLGYISLVESSTTTNFLLTFAGFLILVHYIYHLEKKTGVSNKLIWIKSGLLILSLLIFTYSFY